MLRNAVDAAGGDAAEPDRADPRQATGLTPQRKDRISRRRLRP
jgi:hypothetical protein